MGKPDSEKPDAIKKCLDSIKTHMIRFSKDLKESQEESTTETFKVSKYALESALKFLSNTRNFPGITEHQTIELSTTFKDCSPLHVVIRVTLRSLVDTDKENEDEEV